ncbi:7869_t:CDS:2, partial [Funneliformis mosseae]
MVVPERSLLLITEQNSKTCHIDNIYFCVLEASKIRAVEKLHRS